ncbi:hypothetical protein SAMN05421630_101722 [Prauserella marina]|uniref:Uncharacterized protein n=1 Tax=Prauserella marina TaxID=530584 RepID=A0A1G6JI57_9PSEU|nr:hypothetical protein DES30_101614 [Prauserella marina]SDC18135.1 hypothetical protein SAMN05421630_101722 [Prauserella marina]
MDVVYRFPRTASLKRTIQFRFKLLNPRADLLNLRQVVSSARCVPIRTPIPSI